MNDQNAKAMLAQIDEWAAHRINTDNDPPWTWYHLMMLRDAARRVREDIDGTMTIPVPGPTLSQADNER